MPLNLGALSQTDREEYLWRVFREAEDFRLQKEIKILEVFRYVRGIKDDNSPYRNDLRHPYAYSSAEAQIASLAPIPFSGDPVVQLVDPNVENHERNQMTEKMLTALIKNPCKSNFFVAYLRILMDVVWFGFTYPYTYFRARSKRLGPRFEPVIGPDGMPAVRDDGSPLVRETYRDVTVYNAPWLEHNDVWDTFIHPDKRRGFTRRDRTGYEIMAQSKGRNPMYDPDRVQFMIRREAMRSRRMQQQSFHSGPESFSNRDAMAAEAGAEPLRHDELERAFWAKDILAKPYVLLHYDDGEFSGTYAVSNDRMGLMELRFNQGVNYDGESNRFSLVASASPQEVYGTSNLEWHMPLLKMHSSFYQAAADGMALTVHPTYLVSQQFQTMGGRMVVGPGSMIPVPSTSKGNLEEHVKPLAMATNMFTGLQFTDVMQRDLDRGFGLGDPQRGIFAGGRKTAYETNVVAEGASNRTNLIQMQIENMFLIPMIRKWTAMMAEHYTGRDYVKMLGPDGAFYIPPSTEEIISGMTYVPTGSISSSDQQLRAARWPGILQLLTNTMQFMELPWMHEAVKRALEDQGVDSVSRLIPALGSPQMTEHMMKVQMLNQQGAGQGPGATPVPRSPGDLMGALGISDQMSAAGGATAPPGNANGGSPSGNGNSGRFG